MARPAQRVRGFQRSLYVGDRAASEDIAQEAWVFQAARNLAGEMLRHLTLNPTRDDQPKT